MDFFLQQVRSVPVAWRPDSKGLQLEKHGTKIPTAVILLNSVRSLSPCSRFQTASHCSSNCAGGLQLVSVDI